MKKYKIVTPFKEILGECTQHEDKAYVYKDGNPFYVPYMETLNLTLVEVVPEKKRLYAYEYGGVIGFTTEEKNHRIVGTRAPQYDIIYDEEK
jgi:hypothetical protein